MSSLSMTENDTRQLLDDLKSYFEPDRHWLQRVRNFYAALFENRIPDELMIALPGHAAPGHEKQRFNLREQYHDPLKMLYEHLRVMVARARTGQGAAVPTLRANLGTGFVASVFGIDQLIFEDKMPWPQGHLEKEEIAGLDPDDFADVSGKGLVPYAREIYELYEKELGTSEFCFVPDTQGALDIAHLVRGDEIFIDMYEDSPFVHHLMELALAAYVSVTRAMKAAIHEPRTSGRHSGMFLSNGGVRYCMDTSVLCSRELLETFEVPYLRRALQEFGGGWVHFCGYAPHLTQLLVDVPEVRGVNPNYMDTRPYDYAGDTMLLRENGQFFRGAPFKDEHEDMDAYFARLLAPLPDPSGALFMPRGSGLSGSAAEMQAAWKSALDRRWSDAG